MANTKAMLKPNQPASHETAADLLDSLSELEEPKKPAPLQILFIVVAFALAAIAFIWSTR
jgi:ABC-type transporter Mla subunit MlaD